MLFEFSVNSSRSCGVGSLIGIMDALVLFGAAWGLAGIDGSAHQYALKSDRDVASPEFCVA